MNRLKWICFVIIAFVFLLPALQKIVKPFSPKPLKGYFEPSYRPVLSLAGIKSGDYQEKMGRHLERSLGLREWLVRFCNQIDFSLFSLSHARQVVVGKEDYLFEEPYIDALLGHDFIGKELIDARVDQIRRVQDLLWERSRTLLVVVFPPDKGSFYPEKIPGRYLKKSGEITNYLWYKKRFEETKVNFIDFNDWFIRMKDTSQYLLYPKTGIHWSSYGAFLAFDSLTRYLGARMGKPLVEISYNDLQVTGTARGRDADMQEGMNLIQGISHPPMAYPSVVFKKKPGTIYPAALFIGDSFYFTWSEAGYIAHTFSGRDFWYYDQDVYSGTYNTGKKIQNLNLLEEVSGRDVIVIIQTFAGYGNVGYGFIDRLLSDPGGLNRQGPVTRNR